MTNTNQVTALVTAINEAGKSRSALATLMTSIAAPAWNDPEKQAEVAVLLTSVQRECKVKREQYMKYLSANGRAAERDTFEKSAINAVTYAISVAGDKAGCKFAFDQKSKSYTVKDLPVKGEGKGNTATGKDGNSAEQSAAMVNAAEAAPVLVQGDKQAHLQGVVSSLLKAGYTLSEIEAAVHSVAMVNGKREAEKEQAAAPQVAQAPAILADKLATTMQAKGAKVKTPRKTKAA